MIQKNKFDRQAWNEFQDKARRNEWARTEDMVAEVSKIFGWSSAKARRVLLDIWQRSPIRGTDKDINERKH